MRDALDEMVLSGDGAGARHLRRDADAGAAQRRGHAAGPGLDRRRGAEASTRSTFAQRRSAAHGLEQRVAPLERTVCFDRAESRRPVLFPAFVLLLSATDADDVLAMTDYDGPFACGVAHGNIFGVQFHPEKSHQWGVTVAAELRGALDVLRPRIIPCLLVHDGGLVKTVQFASPKYVGDPLNAVRIFNEKEVDELIVLDIDATSDGRNRTITLIRNLAAECRMPLCYGGGVRTSSRSKPSSAGGREGRHRSSRRGGPGLFSAMAQSVGRQSVVVVLDVRTGAGRLHGCWTHNGTKPTGRDPVEFARCRRRPRRGEIVINSIDRDGVMTGYDLELARRSGKPSVPMTALGGAGSLRRHRRTDRQIGISRRRSGQSVRVQGRIPRRADQLSGPRGSRRVVQHGSAKPGVIGRRTALKRSFRT